ncbi:MAG: GNAT family protein [Erythrobacter sp.]|jgi:RimJ/RimL family protein N-acetyltransferase|nr:GNAT family protein [Erythrobacter sp.]
MFEGLAGKKVRLRPFAPGDITEAYLGWLADPVVTRYSNQRLRTHTRATCEAYLASFAGTANLFVSIRRADDDRAIGTMTAYRNLDHGTCDVGIMVGSRDCWGGGYGQEAWNLLTGWLLDPAGGGVRKLTAGCLSANGAMVKLMERSGMTFEAVRREQELLEGKPCDIVHYARFADGRARG